MSFVDRFLAHFANHKDFSKSSKFEVNVYANDNLLANFGDARGLTFQCEAAELPGYNFDTVEGRVYGAPYAIAARPAFNDLRLTFICAGDMWEKKFFDNWQEFIMSKNNFFPKYRSEYIANIEVIQFVDVAAGNSPSFNQNQDGSLVSTADLRSQIAYRAVFHEAFPTSIDPISLSWADENINRLNVNFKYRYWNNNRVGV